MLWILDGGANAYEKLMAVRKLPSGHEINGRHSDIWVYGKRRRGTFLSTFLAISSHHETLKCGYQKGGGIGRVSLS